MRFNHLYNKLLHENEYQGQHQPGESDYAAPANDLTKLYPDDVYGPKALVYYGSGTADTRSMDRKALKILHSLRDKPDAEVTIYRAIPDDIKDDQINSGDWVTITKDYAISHGEGRLKGEYKILQKTVKAKDIYTDADSFQEFGYRPKK